jgi:hypothetical protein
MTNGSENIFIAVILVEIVGLLAKYSMRIIFVFKSMI